MKIKHPNGFTLPEILIVVTILVVLGLIILVGINPMMQFFKGYDTRRKSDLYKIKIAFEAYYADHDCYPSIDILNSCGSNALEPYLATIPCDPNSLQPYTYYTGPNESFICPQKIAVYAVLANKFDPQGDEIQFCPDTIVSISGDMNYLETVSGCSNRIYCSDWYGCQSGACVLVARDEFPSCSPSTNCDNRCGAPYNQTPEEFCSQISRRGTYSNECKTI
ncbi:hypothetical protein COT86_01430 [Candidatus Collierbacteria bacterium CG10_big_fil_rev_8_21_14_0_10_43_36]|uniref:Type II secretion system protein GspG C-terminal domain-containing protein n=2 Tax=Candidatus Collieribacteriota TaxID=1752725 RepID=A0A2H0VLE4_9BACT|nr:MAG: hypothetical protein COT86_01430 [Candidatus Collierbacteria bacterium CG10_big_fil_rev_8_21_14_0_10_43_36]PJB48269.1 MAG: hypothetical protein CO104_01640 [Candidatus Collierbacteria bacterium CG_4_9_14_3_um_filter_43_16]